MELINTGGVSDDGTGDTIKEAVLKINRNFSEINKRLDYKCLLLEIVWTGLEDNRKAMEDVNYNFEQIQKHLNKL